MSNPKAKFIEDAARVVDGRIEALKEEYARDEKRDPSASYLASDRAAILEAEFCARLIRQLKRGSYRGDPYVAARNFRNKHGDML